LKVRRFYRDLKVGRFYKVYYAPCNREMADPAASEPGVFEKDYPKIDMDALEVYCPGCKSLVRLGRKSLSGRIAGWCAKCGRAVAP